MSSRPKSPKRTPKLPSKKKIRSAIEERIAESNEEILKHLERVPIVQVACERAGISRAAYYKRRKEDPEFDAQTNAAIKTGTFLINDLAESKLVKKINEENMTAIMYWLNNRHKKYAHRSEQKSLGRPVGFNVSSRFLDVEEIKEVARGLQMIGLAGAVSMDEELKKAYLREEAEEKANLAEQEETALDAPDDDDEEY